MSAASYNRGSRQIREQIDREQRKRRERTETCGGVFTNGPGKRFARCTRCTNVDPEKNEGDRCTRLITVVYIDC